MICYQQMFNSGTYFRPVDKVKIYQAKEAMNGKNSVSSAWPFFCGCDKIE